MVYPVVHQASVRERNHVLGKRESDLKKVQTHNHHFWITKLTVFGGKPNVINHPLNQPIYGLFLNHPKIVRLWSGTFRYLYFGSWEECEAPKPYCIRLWAFLWLFAFHQLLYIYIYIIVIVIYIYTHIIIYIIAIYIYITIVIYCNTHGRMVNLYITTTTLRNCGLVAKA